MVRPTRRAVALVAFGLVAALGPAPVWWLSVVACAALMAVDAALAPGRHTLGARFSGPGEVPVGETAEASINVTLGGRRSAAFDLIADLSTELEAQPSVRGILAPGGSRIPLRLHASRRGVVRVERVWIGVQGPLGLVRRTLVIPLDVPIAVLPAVRAGRGAAIRFEESLGAPVGLKSQRFEGDGSEFDALSNFRPGDDHRRIDWKSSARHRALLRRQFRAERDHQIVLALDTGRLMAARIHGIPKLDHAVGAALRLADVALRSGDRVGLFGFDEQPRPLAPPRGGVASRPALVRAAALLEAREVETNFTLAMAALAQSLKRRSLVLVITDFFDTVSAELLVESLRRLVRRHAVVFVTPGDPALDAIAAAAPADLDTLHRAVVASALGRERAVVLERLRRLGIHPIQAAPEALGPEMINRYLDLRRREIA